jgi:hypothetical protein
MQLECQVVDANFTNPQEDLGGSFGNADGGCHVLSRVLILVGA